MHGRVVRGLLDIVELLRDLLQLDLVLSRVPGTHHLLRPGGSRRGMKGAGAVSGRRDHDASKAVDAPATLHRQPRDLAKAACGPGFAVPEPR